jgi:hypothetical protein
MRSPLFFFRTPANTSGALHIRRPSTVRRNKEKQGETRMFLIIGIVLILAWVGGFVVFHTAGFLIHLLLIFAVISIVFHFLRGSSSTV